MDAAAILESRRQCMGGNLSISYATPLHIVRGEGQHLIAADGTRYLDGVNNICHVGHCHPTVVKAAQWQMAVLNTNTRYLHAGVVQYAQRLAATLPPKLCVVYFTCTGSEANELALRLARTYSKQRDVLVVDGAYHGNTNALIDMSPYKFAGPGGAGQQDYVSVVRAPDEFYDPVEPEHAHHAGRRYADDVRDKIDALARRGRKPAAFFCEAVLGCGGQVVPPKDYMRHAFEHVRRAGGVCVVDEVQTGFGRVGSEFWGFQLQEGAVPDIVTMGKPMGNGFPIGAVVTTREIAAAFNNGMEWFSSFSGTPLSSAVGLAVLDVIRDEKLQDNALTVGRQLLRDLTALMAKHPLIGHVRGVGLFLGVELVRDRRTKAPAAATASAIANMMCAEHHILVSTDGPRHNVLKLKPPIVFTAASATRLVECLSRCLCTIERRGGVGGDGVGSISGDARSGVTPATTTSARGHGCMPTMPPAAASSTRDTGATAPLPGPTSAAVRGLPVGACSASSLRSRL